MFQVFLLYFQIVLGILKFFVVVFGGMLIGTVCGALASFITKYTNSVKVVEPIIIFGFAYQSYILAELFHFSGIIRSVSLFDVYTPASKKRGKYCFSSVHPFFRLSVLPSITNIFRRIFLSNHTSQPLQTSYGAWLGVLHVAY